MSHIKLHGVKPRIQYVADGTLTTYEFPFVIFTNADIQVYLNDILQTPETYTVSGVKNTNGGSITFMTPPTNGTIITITRDLSIERTTDFQEGGALRADTLNDEFDYQTACLQQVADSINRSMVLPPYATDTNVDLTLPTPSAGKAIVWNSDGTNLENSTVEVNALESTLKGYKESAESAASTATEKATIATDKAAEAVSTVSTKANKDMDNLSTTGKKAVAHLPMPSSSYLDLTLGSAGSTYFAPANGWYVIRKAASAAGQYWYFANESAGNLCYSITTHNNDQTVEAFIPAKSGDIIRANYNLGGSTTFFRFVYAEGEV